ncbi:hypothetical protein L1987_63074 [Smallanthus sonchifolius]|uniref:Uncharacterized protein n=1 Tax=Smallanthus sonchifolius TaxID=185202 RepID=A0ACB9CC56_9ASTR|nr:hypothetical protein L1987_63074 [Smallanthus sonchifolius]
MSNTPENTVYGGPKHQNPDQRVTLTTLRTKQGKGEAITMVTAYDYPSAVHLDTAGIDIALVGDSASMVVHAIDTAVRILKEGGMDAIKLEGGAPSRISAAKHIVEAGIAVMGHVGLTPQAISVLGGFRPQGKTIHSAVKVPELSSNLNKRGTVVETALALQEVGCFSVVLECVPAPVAAAAISALVYHDLLGMMQHPHHAKVTPQFWAAYSPYKINPVEVDGFLKELQKMGLDKAAAASENF